MQTSGGVYDDDIDIVGDGALQGVEGHRRGVGADLLLHHGHVGAPAPLLKLLYGGGTESVGGAEHHLVSGTLELGGHLADGGCLAHAVDSHHHYHVGTVSGGDGEIFLRRDLGVVLGKHLGYFLAQQVVELGRADIFVARHTLLETLDDAQCRVDADIRGHEDFLKLVEHVVIDLRLSGYGMRDAVEKAAFGLFKPLVESLFLLLRVLLTRKYIEKSHIMLLLSVGIGWRVIKVQNY